MFNTVIIVLAVLIVQRILLPSFNKRFILYILPVILLIIGITLVTTSNNSILMKCLMTVACLVISLITLLMGETSLDSRKKKRQEQFSKDEFFRKQ